MTQIERDLILDREDLPDHPIDLLQDWYQAAIDSGMNSPNAMAVATVDPGGAPSVRNVLLKSYDREGLVFFTNLNSRKARELEGNDQVAATFWWWPQQRQLSIRGTAKRIGTVESLAYFVTRPRGSRIGAWTSPQSEVISSRAFLEQAYEKMKAKFQEGEVPLPDFWGGIRIQPKAFEFLQLRSHRLHDRFQYRLDERGDWLIERLAP